ncbi:MAG: family 10 glycosylhydrolase [Candidatus Aureabacteria bacterium]|nr:family 10 glycosylhydrolase [Candidatus Auribacterota bacterium]
MKNYNLTFFLSTTVFCLIILLSPLHAGDFPVNSLWVPCEGQNRTLDSIEKIDELIDFSVKNKISLLFVQIYRGNRTWYTTDLADDTPAQNFIKQNKKEMLPYLIEKANKNDIEVHAWFNVLRVTRNKDAVILKKLGRNAVTRDSLSRNMLDYKDFSLEGAEGRYYELGDPGIWLDAGNLDVQKYIHDLMDDFMLRYTEIDGIHLDFIRLPVVLPMSPGSRFKGLHFGYGYESVRRFREEFGYDPLDFSKLVREQSLEWDNFRRCQITDIVRKIKKICVLRGKKLSAAVRPWISRAYLTDTQDWPRWMEEGLLDFAIIMNYTDDPVLFKYLSLTCSSIKKISQEDTKIFMGIGAYLLKDKNDILQSEIETLRKITTDGICIFSYDSIKDPDFLYSLINE